MSPKGEAAVAKFFQKKLLETIDKVDAGKLSLKNAARRERQARRVLRKARAGDTRELICGKLEAVFGDSAAEETDPRQAAG